MNREQRRQQARANRRKAVAFGGAATAALGATLVNATPANAATFTVTNLDDGGAGSLRQAILDANGAAGPDIITFQSGLTGTITLTTGQLLVTDSVDIQGPGASALTVSGNNASRVLYLNNGGAELTVSISGLTVAGGAAPRGAGIASIDEDLTLDGVTITGNTASGVGGGLFVDGFNMDVTVTNSTISGNAAPDGGGVYVEDTGGPLTIQGTTISGNTASGDGGGIYFYDPDDAVTISSTTISGNTAAGAGGGIYMYDTDGGPFVIDHTTISGNTAAEGGGIYFYGPDDPVTISSSTISGNTATAGNGGGIHMYSIYTGDLVVEHTTIAGNSATGSGGGVFSDLSGIVVDHVILADNTAATGADISSPSTDARFSLVEATVDGALIDGGGNVLGQDPVLGTLQSNGGPTATRLPGAGSPAINAGDPAFAPPPATDQRGLARVADGRIDIGAVEVVPVVNAAPVAADDVAAVTIGGGPATIAVLANDTDADGDPISVVAVTQGASGTVTFTANGVVYTPAAGATAGTDTFTYTISDGTATDTATVTVTLTAAPVPAPAPAARAATASPTYTG